MKTPSGWARATAYLMRGPRLSPSGSVVSRIKEIVVTEALVMTKEEEIFRHLALCRAALAGGAPEESRGGQEDAFWKVWRNYMRTAFPFDEKLREAEAGKMKEIMEKMDTTPLVVTPLPPPRKKIANAQEVVPTMRRRSSRWGPRRRGRRR